MFLPNNKVSEVAKEMLEQLLQSGDLETNAPDEVRLDLEAVLRQYLRTEQEILNQARDTLATRGLAPSEYGRVLRNLSEQRGVKVGEEAMDYVLDQLSEMLLNSANVEEIYAEDHEIRRKLRIPLRNRANVDQDLDRAVRRQMKHVEEGGTVWEIEYRRMMEDIRRRRGM